MCWLKLFGVGGARNVIQEASPHEVDVERQRFNGQILAALTQFYKARNKARNIRFAFRQCMHTSRTHDQSPLSDQGL